MAREQTRIPEVGEYIQDTKADRIYKIIDLWNKKDPVNLEYQLQEITEGGIRQLFVADYKREKHWGIYIPQQK